MRIFALSFVILSWCSSVNISAICHECSDNETFNVHMLCVRLYLGSLVFLKYLSVMYLSHCKVRWNSSRIDLLLCLYSGIDCLTQYCTSVQERAILVWSSEPIPANNLQAKVHSQCILTKSLAFVPWTEPKARLMYQKPNQEKIFSRVLCIMYTAKSE